MYIFYAYTFDFLHNYTEHVKLSKKMKNNLQNKSGKPLLSTKSSIPSYILQGKPHFASANDSECWSP